MMPAEFIGAVDGVRRWLGYRRDVLITGDTGAGKTTILDLFAQEAVRGGVDTLQFRGSALLTDVDFGAVLASDVVSGSRVGTAPSEAVLVQVLDAELTAGLNIVAVDDLELLDAASVRVIDRLARRPDVLLVATAQRDAIQQPGCAARPLVAERAMAEVAVAALGFWGMSSLLGSLLQGTPDASLISSIVARSAGNAAVASALVDAGRWAGSIELVSGLWTEVRPLDTVPHDMIIRALTGRLSRESLEALETLSWAGPVTLEDALGLVGSSVLTALGRQDRVTVYQTSRGDTVTVSPPALSHALRGRIDNVRRRVLAAQVDQSFGSLVEQPSQPGELVERLIAGGDPAYAEYLNRAAEMAGLVHERAAVQYSSRRGVWLTEPTVRNAVEFIDSLMSRPVDEQVDEIFDKTVASRSDAPVDVANFRMRQAQWMLWQGQDVAAVDRFLRDLARPLGAYGTVLELQADLFEISASGIPAGTEIVQRLREGVPGTHAGVWSVLALAGILLEQGRGEESLEVIDDAPVPDRDSPLIRYLEAARSDALLLLGRVSDAEQWARKLLEDSYDQLDPLGIRLHSLKLAEVLYLTGNTEAAWGVLATGLRLGPPSPFGIAYYERTLALGTVIRADLGDLVLARVLKRELDEYPVTYRPVLGSMRALAEAAILYAEGESGAAESVLADQAARDVERGMLASALLCLTARRTEYPAEDAESLARFFERAPLPLFEPAVRAQAAFVSGSEDDIAAALGSGGAPERLSRLALDVINARRHVAGVEPLTAEEIAAIMHPRVVLRSTDDDTDPALGLTDREREVAQLARVGLSNKEIAGRLFISTRTVENHMYRLLRKLGLATRADLRDKWRPDGEQPFDPRETDGFDA